MNVGDKVTSKQLGPGVWEVTEVYELNVAVTQNGIRHIRPPEWFRPATPDQVRAALLGWLEP